MDELVKLPEYMGFAEAMERFRHAEGESTFWFAREIQEVLGYPRWESFEPVIERARMACESAGVDPANQFLLTTKMVGIGSGAARQVPDWFLSRYACYMIAMSGDATKKEIAYAKTYFAIQTRRQEVSDQMTEEKRRLLLRDRVKDANKMLNATAMKAGVQKFGVFHDAGYRGLYGLSQAEIKAKKGIPDKDKLLDRIGPTELAANFFRVTQAKDKIDRDRINTERDAINTHQQVGATVRRTIKDLGGTPPENLPAAPPIKALKGGTNRLALPAKKKKQ
jgi:DNA-damage-inducible protein D